MAAGSSRRKFKRFQRQSAEQTATVEGLIALFQQYGIHIDFAWQLPEIVEQLLVANKGTIPQTIKRGSIGGGMGRSPQDMMRQLTVGAPVVPRLGTVGAIVGRTAPKAVIEMQEEEEEEEIDSSLVAGLYAEYGDEEEEEDEGDGMPMSQDEMMAAYQAKQAAMTRRVAKEGVKYGKTGAQGPAAGKKLLPHKSTDKRILSAVAAPQLDESEMDEDMDLGNGPDEESSSDDEGGANDGRVNPKTGMSLAKQRQLMSRVLGKQVKPPVPSGIPNTLKK
jgi:hypothetical protein